MALPLGDRRFDYAASALGVLDAMRAELRPELIYVVGGVGLNNVERLVPIPLSPTLPGAGARGGCWVTGPFHCFIPTPADGALFLFLAPTPALFVACCPACL